MTNPTGDEEATRVTTEVFSALGSAPTDPTMEGGVSIKAVSRVVRLTRTRSRNKSRIMHREGSMDSRSWASWAREAHCSCLMLLCSLHASCFLFAATRASPRKKEDGSGVGVPEDYVWSGRKAVAAWQRGSVEVVARANGKGHRGEGRG